MAPHKIDRLVAQIADEIKNLEGDPAHFSISERRCEDEFAARLSADSYLTETRRPRIVHSLKSLRQAFLTAKISAANFSAALDHLEFPHPALPTNFNFVDKRAFFSDRKSLPAGAPENWPSLYDELLVRPVTTRGEFDDWVRDVSDLEKQRKELSLYYSLKVSLGGEKDDVRKAKEEKETFTKLDKDLKSRTKELWKKISEFPQEWLQAPAFQSLKKFLEKNALDGQSNAAARDLDDDIDGLIHQYEDFEADLRFNIQDKDGNFSDLTFQDAMACLTSSDRAVRQTAFDGINTTLKAHEDELDRLLSDLVKKRDEYAKAKGYANYAVYSQSADPDVALTPAATETFLDDVAQTFGPLLDQIVARRAAFAGVSSDDIQAWDFGSEKIGPAAPGTENLKPFEDAADLKSKLVRMYDAIDPEFGDILTDTFNFGRSDFEKREGKKMTAANSSFPWSGLGFLRMNANSDHPSLISAVHESFHNIDSALRSQSNGTFWDYEINNERAEFIGKLGELIGMTHWDIFYPDADDRKRAIASTYEYEVTQILMRSAFSKYQLWIYRHPNADATTRKEQYREILREFHLDKILPEDASEYFAFDHYSKVFRRPFYTLSYVTSAIGALQLQQRYLDDPENTLADLKAAMRDGGKLSVPEFYDRVGLRYSFDADVLQQVAAQVSGVFQKNSVNEPGL